MSLIYLKENTESLCSSQLNESSWFGLPWLPVSHLVGLRGRQIIETKYDQISPILLSCFLYHFILLRP